MSVRNVLQAISNRMLRNLEVALAGMSLVFGVLSCDQKVACSIHSQGTCLGCGFDPQSLVPFQAHSFNPQSRYIQEATSWCFSLLHWCFSLASKFLSLPFSLSKSNEKKSLGEDGRKEGRKDGWMDSLKVALGLVQQVKMPLRTKGLYLFPLSHTKPVILATWLMQLQVSHPHLRQGQLEGMVPVILSAF